MVWRQGGIGHHGLLHHLLVGLHLLPGLEVDEAVLDLLGKDLAKHAVGLVHEADAGRCGAAAVHTNGVACTGQACGEQ